MLRPDMCCLYKWTCCSKCEVRGCSGTIRSVTCRPAGAAPAELQRTSSQGGKPCGSEARTDGGDQLRAPPRSLVKRSPVSPRRCTAAPRPGRPAAILRPHCAAAAAHQGACHLHPASWPRPSPLHWHNGGLGKAGMLESRSTVASSPAHRSVPLSPLITNRERQLAVFRPAPGVLSLRAVQCSEPGSGGAMAAPPARIPTPRKKPPAPPPGCALTGVAGTPPSTSPCGAKGAQRAVAGGLPPPWRGRSRTSGGARQGVRAPWGARRSAARGCCVLTIGADQSACRDSL